MYIIRTDSKNSDFVYLVRLLDSFLNHDRTQDLQTYNNIDTIKHVIVAYSENNEPIACGAIRQYDNSAMEIKRMYVVESERRNNIASSVLSELEVWATELGSNKCILETGRDMPRAIAFYKKNGYTEIDNYEPYTTNLNSICFAKNIKRV